MTQVNTNKNSELGTRDFIIILDFLKSKHCYCKRRNIINETGLKKSYVSKALRELRKQGKVRYGLRRWGYSWSDI
jgi:DNA-binding IclR family transcriptional regulator